MNEKPDRKQWLRYKKGKREEEYMYLCRDTDRDKLEI
jgi:hypothetical protein